MNKVKLDKVGLVLVIMDIVASILFLFLLPEKIPYHWDLFGNVNGWGSKYTILIIALCITGVYTLLSVVIEKIEALKSRRMVSYSILRSILILFLFFHLAVIYISFGHNLLMAKVIGAFLGLILILFGNHFPQLKQNGFIGIKTTWTIKDVNTWNATHRIGGYTALLTGAVMVILSLLLKNESALVISLIVMLIWIIFITLYSFIFYRSTVSKEK